MSDLPGYTWVLVLTGLAAIPVLVCTALYRGVLDAGYAPRTARSAAVGAASIWAGLLAGTGVLAGTGALRGDPEQLRPWLGVASLGVLVAMLAAASGSLANRALTTRRGVTWLAAAQTPRVLGVVFLIAMATGDLPVVFALPAALGDIAVGAAAPWIALRLARGTHRRAAIWFNVLGIVDLSVAVALGFLASAGGVLDVDPSTQALTELPLSLIPTTVVPLAITMHVVSLRGLSRGNPATAQPGPARSSAPLSPR